MSRVLVVADDVRIRGPLEVNLLMRGYDVDLARRAHDELAQAIERHPDAVIVDLQHGQRLGLDTVRDLRGLTSAPIVVLSGSAGDEATVAALDLGADDVLASPFGVGELFARLRATMRRAAPSDGRAVVDTADFTLDLVARQARRRGDVVGLTPIQWRIVEVLTGHTGQLVPYEYLLQDVWGATYTRETNYLRVFMTQIRHKLEPQPSRPRYFLTVPGVGYRFDVDGVAGR